MGVLKPVKLDEICCASKAIRPLLENLYNALQSSGIDVYYSEQAFTLDNWSDFFHIVLKFPVISRGNESWACSWFWYQNKWQTKTLFSLRWNFRKIFAFWCGLHSQEVHFYDYFPWIAWSSLRTPNITITKNFVL